MKTISVMRTAGLLVAFFFTAAPVSAITITHNGNGTGGIITGATGDINVFLADLTFTATGNPLTNECSALVNSVDGCLGKQWNTGTEGDTHIMQVTPDASETQLVEWVFNTTGVPLTGYSIDISGATLNDWSYQFFVINSGDQSIVSSSTPNTGGSATGTDTSLQIQFDAPLEDISNTDPYVLFELSLILNTTPDQSFTVSQTPATVPLPAAVWLFGSGSLGLIGIARRKKAA